VKKRRRKMLRMLKDHHPYTPGEAARLTKTLAEQWVRQGLAEEVKARVLFHETHVLDGKRYRAGAQPLLNVEDIKRLEGLGVASRVEEPKPMANEEEE